MAFFKRLFENINHITSKQVEVGATADLGFEGIYGNDPNIKNTGNQAVYPDWFFTARLGQPRGVDIREIRQLAKSPWVQMVLNTFKKQIYSMDWDIILENEEMSDEELKNKQEDIYKIKKYLLNINFEGQSINDIASESITDIGEIDAGCWNFVYSSDSYSIENIPVYDAYGKQTGTEPSLLLKPLGQREIMAIKTVDGGSILKQVDVYKNLQGYYQYSFKHPRLNPTPFQKEEIVYLSMNKRPYSIYGFSPVQSVQQVLDLLIQGTRYNKDLYHNNAIPDIIATLPKVPTSDLKKLKRSWNMNFKNKPHQVGFVNWAIDQFYKLGDNNRDLEWLEGQKWYFKLVFGVFNVSPEEAGFTESSNRATGDSQERVTVRNALEPYLLMFEQVITKNLITEILQKEDHGLRFKYIKKDSAKEKQKFEQKAKLLEMGVITINEYRKTEGKDPVEWGDEPLRRGYNQEESFNNFNSSISQQQHNDDDDIEDKEKSIKRARFEGFLNGRNSIK